MTGNNYIDYIPDDFTSGVVSVTDISTLIQTNQEALTIYIATDENPDFQTTENWNYAIGKMEQVKADLQTMRRGGIPLFQNIQQLLT